MVYWTPEEYQLDRDVSWKTEHDDSRPAWEDAGRPDVAYWSSVDHSANYAAWLELQDSPAPTKRGRKGK